MCKFEPTCVFMGAIVSDNDSNSIGHKCEPKIGNGMNNQLIGGEGTIEMIRKTPDGKIIVNDPNSRINSRKKWDAKRLLDQMKGMWAFSV